jgi:hypothetical protein
MAFTPKPGSGSLFKNERKEKDTHPDYRGDVCLEDGTVLKLAGWVKKTSGGKSFLSLKVEKPREETRPDDTFRGSADSGVSGGAGQDPYGFDDESPF